MPGKTLRELERLEQLIAQGANASPGDYQQWRDSCALAVEAIYGLDSPQVESFSQISFSLMMFTGDTPDSAFLAAEQAGINRTLEMLKAFADDVRFAAEAPEAQLSTPALCIHGSRDLPLSCGETDTTVRRSRKPLVRSISAFSSWWAITPAGRVS